MPRRHSSQTTQVRQAREDRQERQAAEAERTLKSQMMVDFWHDALWADINEREVTADIKAALKVKKTYNKAYEKLNDHILNYLRFDPDAKPLFVALVNIMLDTGDDRIFDHLTNYVLQTANESNFLDELPFDFKTKPKSYYDPIFDLWDTIKTFIEDKTFA